jgi:uncharacterized membrane protein YdjX (TVP38/TMEM64 family)
MTLKLTARIILALIAFAILFVIFTSKDEFVQFIGALIIFCAFMWFVILLLILAFPKTP